MFPSLRNINRGDHSTTTSHILRFLLLLQNPSLLLIRIRSISSSSSSISISSSTNHTSSSSSSSSSSFVVSYLMNSCGLSEDRAISASKKVHFETSSRPDSVLTLLQNSGFTKPYISKLISTRPPFLLADPHKTLKPKLEFFNSMGLSGLDLAKVLSGNPNILQRSLEKHIIPYLAFLKSIVHTDKNVVTSLKRSPWVLSKDPGKVLALNIGVLRDQGVPESNITKLLLTHPRTLLINSDWMKEIVEEIKGRDFDPVQTTFVLAIHVLASMKKSSWEAKLDVFRRWGWSEDEIRTAFRKQPFCIMTSEKKIMAIMDFLVNQMGFSSSLMAKHPNVLLYSLEKRIIPRCSVIRVLVSKGFDKKKFCITSILVIAEKSFLEKYVIKYEQEVPELMNAFQGQLDMLSITTG
ncbi:Mitochodrial transcription termination factor-related [Macleaya cordata]|uniref:Mitochodrial transcription termination factor-related n=1 Tax=Macleaya cordata TaxID=56857 RepID=A0A200Q7J1_MACCD|nr:Mitochodrial transcription termination factor-related [Macleaya cordata]